MRLNKKLEYRTVSGRRNSQSTKRLHNIGNQIILSFVTETREKKEAPTKPLGEAEEGKGIVIDNELRFMFTNKLPI